MRQTTTIRANWIWTGMGEPLADGCVTIDNDRIVSVSTASPAWAIDLGSYCILPGLINSHTHLEFSDLKKPVPIGSSFADWILNVVQHRRINSSESVDAGIAAELRGLIECRENAVRLVLDIVQAAQPHPVLPKVGPKQFDSNPNPKTIRFAELMSTTLHRAEQTWHAAFQLKRHSTMLGPNTYPFGLSPHAPYTTTSSQVRQAVARCNRWKTPIMMHLAESNEEIRWLESGDGPLQDLLDMVVGPDVLSTKHRLPVAGYVHELCQAPLALIVHGNYLDEPSMAILETHREHSAVVFCPRTHTHFGHAKYPLMELRRRGIPVVLGTDSRASNPDLSIFSEARRVRQLFPEMTAAEIMAMITTQPAETLRCENDWGTIRPGGLGQLTAVPCEARQAKYVLNELLESSHQAIPCEAAIASLSRE